MRLLLKVSDVLGDAVEKIGRLAAWVAIALIAVILFDVVSRRFFAMGSSKLQELEWHFHTVLFMFCLGIGYIHDTHVRIDMVREKLGRRAQCWIEILGCVLFLIPFCLVVIHFGAELTHRSWLKGEISSSATGLPFRWLIKSAIPIGMSVLLLSAFSVLFRRIVMLFRPDLCGADGDIDPQDEIERKMVRGAD
ncbi:MAG: TRAP transporter small permease subunit [Rhodospirillales bacterium]|jgi:TRAP-type mannitol/chloroaromatic compound transport system permease small subunit|nr:TRAP transporter small permease subunit [Rhodospirillales bacterium]